MGGVSSFSLYFVSFPAHHGAQHPTFSPPSVCLVSRIKSLQYEDHAVLHLIPSCLLLSLFSFPVFHSLKIPSPSPPSYISLLSTPIHDNDPTFAISQSWKPKPKSTECYVSFVNQLALCNVRSLSWDGILRFILQIVPRKPYPSSNLTTEKYKHMCRHYKSYSNNGLKLFHA